MAATLLILSTGFKNLFVVTFSSIFTAKCLLNIAPQILCVATLPCETFMSENERQSPTNAVINDQLQGRVVTYLRCNGIFSNQIKNSLLLSLPADFFNR